MHIDTIILIFKRLLAINYMKKHLKNSSESQNVAHLGLHASAVNNDTV